MRRATGPTLILACALTQLPGSAWATWSIVAVDPSTGDVGVAGASCIGGSEVIAQLVPGTGAIVAQAFTHRAARERLAELLAEGRSPKQAIRAVANQQYDSFLRLPLHELRQYGVAALGFEGEPANFTGRWTFGWAGAATGAGVTVQGNTLRGPEVVENALASFEALSTVSRATLADRLFAALEAGARAGGDARCSKNLAALSAFLFVATPYDDAGSPAVHLVATRPGEPSFNPWTEFKRLFVQSEVGTREESAVYLLRKAYETHRKGKGLPEARGPGGIGQRRQRGAR